ncbi:HIT-like protein [Coemansia reversa NRRL 1564]|uniref:Bis(5'-adenosyl)-triphosphatase n=1 Tax=Coemansia reversa (strain ATCC 12441 / NRRL 1564) TaxID=763665 RepID=A0A2G5BD43_COERN|nr:HIT-like protein [Coemansia reversa NRRL 1564]|eukprot:PIA16930.1 HIT-like protein [Coemansia reversa NRRL 1564]
MALPVARTFWFGPLTIPLAQLFLLTKHTLGIVNIKPIRPGHVLVVTRRQVARFNELSQDEIADLFAQGQRVSKIIERLYSADGLTLCIQDGSAAGQTVPHVHLHVIPRHIGDFANNDDIYSVLDGTGKVPLQTHIDNEQRRPRSLADMTAEAEILRREIGDWDSETVT